MAYAFDEVTIDSGYGAVLKGGPKASTAMISNPAGLRQANTNRLDRIREWSIDYGLLTATQLQSLYLFHMARFGMARGFKFIDPIDSVAAFEEIGTLNGSTTVFKLKKAYGSYVRRIVKPVTVSLFQTVGLSVVPIISGFSVDMTTGTVTFVVAPAGTETLMWSGTFSLPVIFGSDDFNASVDSAVSSEWNGVDLIELLPVTLGIT